jgi:hypothetical protein
MGRKGRRRLMGGSGGCSSLERFGRYALALTHREAPAGMGMVTGWRLTDASVRTVTY